MSNLIKLHELDCIFLSYDEPNAEYNYADLLTKAPWAKRVHGVKGSDAAHKACADQSDTEHFITVDGDNIIDPKFFDLEIDLNHFKTGADSQLSWSGLNNINQLMYGNGGLKCWTREHVWNMKTHESAADDTNQVDFCWDPRYHHMTGCYSVVHNNATPLQAWRAGFREGVKMCLLNGIKLTESSAKEFKRRLPEQNYQRLLIWMTIGQDVKNGLWAIYGARLGCYMTTCTDWDYTQVRDFEYLNNLFKEKKLSLTDETALKAESARLGKELSTTLAIPIAEFDHPQSNFYKATYNNLPRSNQILDSSSNFVTQVKLPQYFDIVFISNGEPNAEEHWKRLLEVAPKTHCKIHRVDGVSGILNAHKAAADLAETEMFFVVDADAWIIDTFRFLTDKDDIDLRYTHVYHTINPTNNLCYGYGGVKLFPKRAFDQLPDGYIDMTTTIGEGLRVMPIVSNITRFNTDPFSTWRSAFRECAKLASKSINGQIDQSTEYRLEQWLNSSEGQHSEWARKGAEAGKEFGLTQKENMQKINDYDFLQEMFNG